MQIGRSYLSSVITNFAAKIRRVGPLPHCFRLGLIFTRSDMWVSVGVCRGDQCDQIGRFLKALADDFSHISSPNVELHFWFVI